MKERSFLSDPRPVAKVLMTQNEIRNREGRRSPLNAVAHGIGLEARDGTDHRGDQQHGQERGQDPANSPTPEAHQREFAQFDFPGND